MNKILGFILKYKTQIEVVSAGIVAIGTVIALWYQIKPEIFEYLYSTVQVRLISNTVTPAKFESKSIVAFAQKIVVSPRNFDLTIKKVGADVTFNDGKIEYCESVFPTSFEMLRRDNLNDGVHNYSLLLKPEENILHTTQIKRNDAIPVYIFFTCNDVSYLASTSTNMRSFRYKFTSFSDKIYYSNEFNWIEDVENQQRNLLFDNSIWKIKD